MTGLPIFMEGELKSLDPELAKLIEVEDIRQDNKILLIASESLSSRAVRQALSTSFTNMYAEGYPSTRMSVWEKKLLSDHARHLSFYRRYADNRYYKGVDIIDIMESVAQKRCSEVFANQHASMEDIFVNVQPLSGAAANNAVYNAFLQPGDTVMGMDLTSGGHLTHGSPVNRSGKNFNIVSYSVDDKGRIDYGDIERRAMECKPKIIIAGYSAYPWSVDWERLRDIAHANGGLLMADISHVAGLVIADEFPNPVGIADITTFTTHKTLFGPRGAVIITTNRTYADKINIGVFPGEQGGPHENNIAAKAVAFEIAKTDEFKDVQRKITANAQALAEGFRKRGIGLAYGGTDSHFLLVDLKSLKSSSGGSLNGEIVSRILEICGIVCNKNTIVGDDKAAFPSGIRLGTPIITQRGLDTDDMDELADIITTALKGMDAFSYVGKTGDAIGRARIDYSTLENVKERVRKLVEKMGRNTGKLWDYPYFYSEEESGKTQVFRVRGERSPLAMTEIFGTDCFNQAEGGVEPAFVTFDGKTVSGEVFIFREKIDSYLLAVTAGDVRKVMTWMRGLSDGYLKFDDDMMKKIDGPFIVEDSEFALFRGIPKNVGFSPIFSFKLGDSELSVGQTDSNASEGGFTSAELLAIRNDHMTFDGSVGLAEAYDQYPGRFIITKPYFIGHGIIDEHIAEAEVMERYEWNEPEEELKRSCLYEEHVKLGATMVPFAGWEMPVKYGQSILEEHQAVRTGAGLFDVSHMGVFGFSGKEAARFLDSITSNFVHRLRPGEAQYSYLADHDGNLLDDIFLYMIDHHDYMMVVNAANIDKDWAWIQGVLDEKYMIDKDRGHVKVDAKPKFIDLKDPVYGDEARVDIAFQGPMSRRVLLELLPDDKERKKLITLKSSELFVTTLAGLKTIIARTGYTGEPYGYEIFVHPDQAVELWNAILEEGKDLDVRPTGLGARDSTRVEAGFPLYGHELAGPYGMIPHGAGYGYFVKFHKPFFAGREGILEKEKIRKLGTARILVEKGAQTLKFGDYVVSKTGKCIGYITSSALVKGQQIALAYVKKNIVTSDGITVGLIPQAKLKKAATAEIRIGTSMIPVIKGEVMSRFFNKSSEWPDVIEDE